MEVQETLLSAGTRGRTDILFAWISRFNDEHEVENGGAAFDLHHRLWSCLGLLIPASEEE
jgi:hypothetical protein